LRCGLLDLLHALWRAEVAVHDGVDQPLAGAQRHADGAASHAGDGVQPASPVPTIFSSVDDPALAWVA
jgi:inosine-uridine nucleoside N-ribohydrolase